MTPSPPTVTINLGNVRNRVLVVFMISYFLSWSLAYPIRMVRTWPMASLSFS